MIDQSVIRYIFRDIVKRYPHDPCFPLDTFVEVGQGLPYNEPAMGKTFEDYEQGTFWARDWVASGADRNTMKGDLACVALEQKTWFSEDFLEGNGTFEFYVVTFDQVDCLHCESGCSRTRIKVKEFLFNAHKAILTEFMKYMEVDVIPAIGDPFTTWATESTAEYFITEGIWTSYKTTGLDIEGATPADFRLEINEWGEGFAGNLEGYASSLSLEVECDTNEFEFSNPKDQPEQVGSTKCEGCP